jgi:hypothetical protein
MREPCVGGGIPWLQTAAAQIIKSSITYRLGFIICVSNLSIGFECVFGLPSPCGGNFFIFLFFTMNVQTVHLCGQKRKNRVLFVAEAEKCNAQDTLEYGHRHDNTYMSLMHWDKRNLCTTLFTFFWLGFSTHFLESSDNLLTYFWWIFDPSLLFYIFSC